MIVYDTFKVVETDEAQGEMVLEWSASNTPNIKLLMNHRVPPESAENNWTEEQFRTYFVLEVEDAPAIPAWAIAEEDVYQNRMYLESKGRWPE